MAELGMGYIIMIVLGIIGIILILYFFKESILGVGDRLVAMLGQAKV